MIYSLLAIFSCFLLCVADREPNATESKPRPDQLTTLHLDADVVGRGKSYYEHVGPVDVMQTEWSSVSFRNNSIDSDASGSTSKPKKPRRKVKSKSMTSSSTTDSLNATDEFFPDPENLVLAPAPPKIVGCRHCFEWTSWMNSDGPNGVGDVETIGPPNKAGIARTISRAFPDAVCTYPVRMECREAITKKKWHLTEDNITYKCQPSPGLGFLCLNRMQAKRRRCHDYEVRFLCIRPCACFQWSEWVNFGHPEGKSNGDYEVLGLQGLPKQKNPCFQQSVIDVECRSARDGLSVYKTTDRNVRCLLHGLRCDNHEQKQKRCKDYEVRFLCQVDKQARDRRMQQQLEEIP